MSVKASHRGITLDPLHPNVSQLVSKYESVWGDGRSTETLKEIHSRTPFITVSSNALVGGINGSQYQLQGDWQAHSSFEKLANKRTGFANTRESKFMYYGGKARYLPKAGVSELSVDSKGGLGSIRYGSLKLKAFRKDDLEIIEKYYMVPGMRILVQWGWSTFGGELIDLYDKKYNHGNGEIDIQQDIVKKVLGVSSLYESVPAEGSDDNTPGRYDAMIGLVTKFDWSLDEGGAYNITIELTSTNGLMLTTPMDSAQLAAALITTKETYEDNYPWPLGDGDQTYSETESNRPIGDIEAILFGLEDSSGKGVWTGEGGDDGMMDFDGSSVQRNTKLYIGNKYIQKQAPYSFGIKKEIPVLVKDESNDGDLGDKVATATFRPIITKKVAGTTKPLDWSQITGKDRSIIRGPIRAVEHTDSWHGQTYGYQGALSNTDAGNIQKLINCNKVGTWISYRFIEDILINFIGIPKNGEGLPVVGLSSTHEVFGDWTKYTSAHKPLTSGYANKRYLSNKCVNHPHLRSTNPDVCMLPGQQGFPCTTDEMEALVMEACSGRENDWSNAAAFGFWASSVGNGLTKGTSGFYQSGTTGALSWSRNRYNRDEFDTFSANSKCNEGYIRNIMFNTQFVAETYRNNPSMDNFLKALLEGANNACGNVWDFTIKANPNDNGLIQVTDNNLAPGLKEIVKKKLKVYQLKANSAQTILTNVQMTSKLPDAVKNAAMCAMTATEPDNTTNEDSVLFKMYGIGVEDRFTRKARKEWKEGPGLTEKEEKEKYDKAAKKVDELEKKGYLKWSASDMEDYKAALAITGGAGTIPADLKYKQWCYSYWYSVITGNQTDQRTAATNLKEYISQEMNFGEGQESTSTLMPIELSFDIEGISGFLMGNAISCAPVSKGGILPDRYHNSALFQVAKVDHSIGRESWKTSVTTLMRMTNAQVPKRSANVIKTTTPVTHKRTATSPPGDYNPPVAKGKAEDYLNYDSFEKTWKKKGYTWMTNGEVNSGAIRVNNFERHGTTGKRKDGMGFIDWFCHAYIEDGKKVFEAHACTTLPGSSVMTKPNSLHKSGGWAILKPGMYYSHTYDWHNRSKKSGHLAGSQRAGSVTVYRDATLDNKHDLNSTTLTTGYFGINLHRSHPTGQASRVGNYSWGCQVFLNNSDFLRWTSAVSSKNSKSKTKPKKIGIPFALFDEGDMVLKT